MPLYENIHGRMVVFWLSNIGVCMSIPGIWSVNCLHVVKGGAGPLILTWINEICTADTEKRAFTVALANDLAYVVQAVVSAFLQSVILFYIAKTKTGPEFCLENHRLPRSPKRIPLVNNSANFTG